MYTYQVRLVNPCWFYETTLNVEIIVLEYLPNWHTVVVNWRCLHETREVIVLVHLPDLLSELICLCETTL